MYKILNGVRVVMTPREVKEHEATQAQAQAEMKKYEATQKAVMLEKVFSLQDDGLSEQSIKKLVPEAEEIFQSDEYLEKKRLKAQKKLALIEAQQAEEEKKQAEKTAGLRAKIKVLKKKGFDEETIKIILPESEALFKVGGASTKRVGKVSK